MTTRSLAAVLAALITTLVPHSAPWGPEGHHLVARLAWTLLTPRARARADSILDGSSIELAATWADSVRRGRPATAPLHYVDIPFNAPAYDSARDCDKGRCVLAAIERYKAVLADHAATPLLRTEALKFIIHFVGDVHQPLHDEDNGDKGGNDVQVHLMGRATNLHAAWDSGILTANGLTEEQYFAELQQKLKTLDTVATKQGTLVEWAEEGHHLAVIDAYHLPANNDLGAVYVQANVPVIELQILRAAVRLAKILNEVLG